MRAIQFQRFGAPDVLQPVELPDPLADAGHAVVRIEAASINPSDVKNVAGLMSQTTLPRVPGRDYAGVVEAGPAAWIGARVWGSGGDVGFTRDGTHAEKLRVPVAALSRMPATLSFEQAASAGVNFITAWLGVVDAAQLQAGETLAVIGASGGVGSAAAQIAAQLGARVIGVDRREPPAETAIRRVASALLVGAADVAQAVREATGGRGADVVYDTVGGAMFRIALDCLALRGRLIEISAGSQREASFDLADFYHRELRLLGVDSLKRDLTAAARVLDRLAPAFERGEFQVAPIAATLPLERAAEAYALVARGAGGRVVLRP